MKRLLRMTFTLFLAIASELLAVLSAGHWMIGTNGVSLSTTFGYGVIGLVCGLAFVVDVVEGVFAFIGSQIGPPQD